MFSRQADGDYEIYTIKPDGTGVKRLTHSRGNDAHMAWSPDGEHIVFASTRMGFKDEVTYTDAPQPYGEIFVMRFDGTAHRAADRQPVGRGHAGVAAVGGHRQERSAVAVAEGSGFAATHVAFAL